MIVALALGCSAALVWSAAALASAPASRLAQPARALLWSSVVSGGLAAVLALRSGAPSGTLADWAFVGLAGVAYFGGAGLFLLAVQAGQVSVVTPVVGCDGAIAVILAAVTGAAITPLVGAALAVIVVGVVVVTRATPVDAAIGGALGKVEARPIARTVAMAAGSAACFGLVFFASARAEGMQPLWVVAISRGAPALLGAILVLRVGRLLPPAEAWKWILGFGFGDSVGYMLYVLASRHDRAVAPVATSQYAALAALGGVLILRERLSVAQMGGVGALLLGIVVIAARGAA